MKKLTALACLAVLAAGAKTIQMPPTCTTPDGMCVDSKGCLVIACPNNDRIYYISATEHNVEV